MSNSEREIQNLVRRYWIEDGIPDLIVGSIFIIYAALLWWGAHSTQPWINMFSAVALIIMMIFSRPLTEKLKEKITYPRTGYIKYASTPLKHRSTYVILWLGVAALLVLLVLVALIIGGESSGMTLIWILLPLVFSALIGMIAYSQKSKRYIFYAIFSLLSGLGSVIIAQQFPEAMRNTLVFGVGIMFPLGVVMIIAGIWTMINYLRQHPEPVDEA